ncbi:hypothetical protein EZV62_027457 [Acer yangbiense]|uniref:MULE transposase domain-containing protein n=1 Tax=Acer yangbiense TaxID=1000413 RepID=A0A5C7GU35_9ROSI|nr:hypothetical protein EZV62_027457 [Acer yangbiense]
MSLQVSDILVKEIISVTDAEEFYKKYLYNIGFSMRKDRLRRDTHGLITIRRYFSDIISFDSTYKTNAYKRLLVIFVGVNNHTKTMIFDFELLVDETVDTYTWILQTFLEAMHSKCPISVITNGDKAMGKAIKLVMPTVVCHLCSWQLERNMHMKLGDSSAIKAMNMHHIPKTLIMQHWTMNAKDVSEVESSSTITSTNIIEIARLYPSILLLIWLLWYQSLVGAVPTAGEEDQIPPVAAASDLEVSTGKEGTSSEAASSCKEVIPTELGNLSNSFNSCFNMKFDIDKFDGSGDLGIWRRKVKALLSQQKILKAIEGPEKLPVSLTKEQKNDMLDMSLGTIILSLSDNVLREVNDEKTACDVWKKLESLYLTKSLTNKIYLKERLFGFKMDASKGLGENLDDFKKMIIELANAGVDEKLSDENETIILLNSLPDSFKDVKAAIKYGRTFLSPDECISALKSKDLELKMEKNDSGENLFVRGR